MVVNGKVSSKKRLLTGLRPTGKFHLGNYVGTFEKDLELQDSGQYECFFLIADLHTLTTGYETSRQIGDDIREGVLDFLAVGIDPARSTLYLQSLVPEVSELFLLFTMLVSAPRAQRIPTLKEQVRDLKLESASLGLLSYPVLQAADILMVRGEVVPVGKDQLSHIELTREIARRFNQLYAPVFPEPEGLLGRFPVLPGTDGQAKMSKSIGNTIMLSDDAETVRKKVMSMYTDPTRLRATDPGHVKGNPVFVYHDAFNTNLEEVHDLKTRYTKGKVGDVEVKQKLAAALNRFLDPIRERRAEYERQPGLLDDILAEGTRRARIEARDTLGRAREGMGLDYFAAARARVEAAVAGEGLTHMAAQHVYPSLAELGRMAASAHYAPIYREVLADVETPVSALLKLGAGPGSFLLESVEGGEFVARYSFVAAGLERSLAIYDDRAVYSGAEGSANLAYSDPLDLIDRMVAREGVARLPGLPRFGGGAVGYLAYELARKFEPRIPLATNNPLELPLAHLLMVDTLLVFDHLRRTIKAVTYVPLTEDLPTDYRRGCERLDDLLDRLRSGAHPTGLEDAPRRAQRPDGTTSNTTQAEYEDMVRQAKEAIAAGECFQIVPSQRLSVRTSASPVGLYRALRSINPSPYMYFLNFGDYQIVGASPELLVLVEDGDVMTRPIAGTMPRGDTPDEDEALASRLLSDEKERAEHIMLVDLGRNDVGRVAEPGTVHVPRLMEIERYSHVMHIVSDVHGRLRPGLRPIDALRACFPAGTLTGAPKIRAMEIIAELESDQRGPYGGAIGFFNRDGDLETAITIRTLVLKEGVAHIQVGAGIVADSDPPTEYQETLNKANAVLAAVAEAERMEGRGGEVKLEVVA